MKWFGERMEGGCIGKRIEEMPTTSSGTGNLGARKERMSGFSLKNEFLKSDWKSLVWRIAKRLGGN